MTEDLNPDGSVNWPCMTCGKGTWPCDCPCADPRCAAALAAARAQALEEAAKMVQDDWEHEIRVSGLPAAIRALIPKEKP